jgi:hypothetical protein
MLNPDWERLWRTAGIQFVVLYILAFLLYGDQPKVGASTDKLVSFYDGDRTRILIAAVIAGLAILNLLWFGAALTSALRDAGQGGWGNAATASSTALAVLFLLMITIGAALAYSVAGTGDAALIGGLNDVLWVLNVIASFPAAMLIMAGSFGLWRTGLISQRPFLVGVAAVIVVLAGGTTWASGGFWAPDGAYLRFVVPIVGCAWVLVVSAFLTRSLSSTRAPEPAMSGR